MTSVSRRSFIKAALETNPGVSACCAATAPAWSRGSSVTATPLGGSLVLLTGAGATVVTASTPVTRGDAR